MGDVAKVSVDDFEPAAGDVVRVEAAPSVWRAEWRRAENDVLIRCDDQDEVVVVRPGQNGWAQNGWARERAEHVAGIIVGALNGAGELVDGVDYRALRRFLRAAEINVAYHERVVAELREARAALGDLSTGDLVADVTTLVRGSDELARMTSEMRAEREEAWDDLQALVSAVGEAADDVGAGDVDFQGEKTADEIALLRVDAMRRELVLAREALGDYADGVSVSEGAAAAVAAVAGLTETNAEDWSESQRDEVRTVLGASDMPHETVVDAARRVVRERDGARRVHDLAREALRDVEEALGGHADGPLPDVAARLVRERDAARAALGDLSTGDLVADVRTLVRGSDDMAATVVTLRRERDQMASRIRQLTQAHNGVELTAAVAHVVRDRDQLATERDQAERERDEARHIIREALNGHVVVPRQGESIAAATVRFLQDCSVCHVDGEAARNRNAVHNLSERVAHLAELLRTAESRMRTWRDVARAALAHLDGDEVDRA